MKQISRIKDHSDIFRDERNNAILFSPLSNEDSSKKRLNLFRSQQEDINNIKKEMMEMKSILTEIMSHIKEGKGDK